MGLLLVVCFGMGVVLCGIPILLAELQVRSIVYYVTNKRIIYERTLFSKQASTFTYKKITDIHLTQSFIGRSVKVGNIYINTAGTPFMELKMKGVKKPFAIKRSLDKYYSEA